MRLLQITWNIAIKIDMKEIGKLYVDCVILIAMTLVCVVCSLMCNAITGGVSFIAFAITAAVLSVRQSKRENKQ